MKRYFLFAALVAVCLSVVAQDTIYIYSGRRVVSAHAVSQIDSISFNPPAPMIFNGHEYVDLGLPSGTLWATCNLGANSPGDYGDYYLWGMTTPMSCEENNSRFDYYIHEGFGSESDPMAYYVNNIVSYAGSSFDAATINWGTGWQTPTNEQITELVQNVSIRRASYDGVDGYLLTSALNGYSIFLPSAGDYNVNCSRFRSFGNGSYMSSTPVTTSGTAGPSLIKTLYWDGIGFHWGSHEADNNREWGAISIRPVAMYNPNIYTVEAYSNGNGTIIGGGEYVEGTTILLRATPNEGYQFSGWNDGNIENPRAVTMTGDAAYTATFEPIPND